MSEQLTPLTPQPDYSAQAEAERRLSRQQASDAKDRAPTWVWTLVGVIVLLSFVSGGIAGFLTGRWYEQNRGEHVIYPADYYMLFGAQLIDEEDGSALHNLYPQGPAESAGLQEGDLLLQIEDREIAQASDIEAALAGYGIGDTVLATYERSHRIAQVYVTLGLITPVIVDPITPMPPEPPLPPIDGQNSDARLGIYYRMLQPGDPFAVSEGAQIIAFLGSGTPGERAGLQPGDIITQIGDQPVNGSSPLEVALDHYSAGQRITVTVNRAGEDLSYQLTLGGG